MEKQYRVLPQSATGMPELPPNPNYIPPEERKAAAEKQAVRRVRKVRRSQVGASARKPAAKGKAAPRQQPSSAVQPRDRLGRFASFAGRALAGTARGIVGTVRAADRIATGALQDMTGTRPVQKRVKRKGK